MRLLFSHEFWQFVPGEWKHHPWKGSSFLFKPSKGFFHNLASKFCCCVPTPTQQFWGIPKQQKVVLFEQHFDGATAGKNTSSVVLELVFVVVLSESLQKRNRSYLSFIEKKIIDREEADVLFRYRWLRLECRIRLYISCRWNIKRREPG